MTGGAIDRDAIIINLGADPADATPGLERRLSRATPAGTKTRSRRLAFVRRATAARSAKRRVARGAGALARGARAAGTYVRTLVTPAGVAVVVSVGGVLAFRFISGQSLESLGHRVGGSIASARVRAQQHVRNQLVNNPLLRRHIARSGGMTPMVQRLNDMLVKQREPVERGLQTISQDPHSNPIGSQVEAAIMNNMRVHYDPFRYASKEALDKAERIKAEMLKAQLEMEAAAKAARKATKIRKAKKASEDR